MDNSPYLLTNSNNFKVVQDHKSKAKPENSPHTTAIDRDHFYTGLSFSKQGNHAQAVTYYKKAIELNSNFSKAYYACGLSLAAQSKHKEAVAYYSQAISLNPFFSEAYCDCGLSLSAQGKHKEAIAKYTQAIELNPHSSEAYFPCVLSLFIQGKDDNANQKFSQTIDLFLKCNPNKDEPEDGVSSLSQDNVEAIVQNDEIGKANQNRSFAHLLMGFLLYQQHHYEEAIAEYNRARALNPEDNRISHLWRTALENFIDADGMERTSSPGLQFNSNVDSDFNVSQENNVNFVDQSAGDLCEKESQDCYNDLQDSGVVENFNFGITEGKKEDYLSKPPKGLSVNKSVCSAKENIFDSLMDEHLQLKRNNSNSFDNLMETKKKELVSDAGVESKLSSPEEHLEMLPLIKGGSEFNFNSESAVTTE